MVYFHRKQCHLHLRKIIYQFVILSIEIEIVWYAHFKILNFTNVFTSNSSLIFTSHDTTTTTIKILQ